MKKKEKNISEFNKDVKKSGRYVYTNFQEYSFFRATKRQTNELNALLRKISKKKIKILDVGCGDGTFTIEMYKRNNIKNIVGFDSAGDAIKIARRGLDKSLKNNIKFLQGDVYNAHKMFKNNSFDVIIIRGVLHHLYQPKKAIKSLSLISSRIIIIEPNGYNPLLKIIEKVSRYHRRHEEKSYLPPTLNSWFKENGYLLKEQYFFSIVPYFAPKALVKVLEAIEPLIESIPILNTFLCGTNLAYYAKASKSIPILYKA